MILLALVYLKEIVDFLARSARIIALVFAVFLWFTGFIDTCVLQFFESMDGLFTTVVVGGLKQSSASNFGILEHVGYINAFVPVSEFVGLTSIYLTAWLTVILIRWTKSIIPTLAN